MQNNFQKSLFFEKSIWFFAGCLYAAALVIRALEKYGYLKARDGGFKEYVGELGWSVEKWDWKDDKWIPKQWDTEWVPAWALYTMVYGLGCFFVFSTKPRRLRGLNPLPYFVCSIASSEIVFQPVKLIVGSKRPNFYQMCGYDLTSQDIVQDVKGDISNCKMSDGDITRASTSFPSGHAAICGAAFGFLILEYGCKHNVCTTISLLVLSIFIVVSRVLNEFHRPIDVTAGYVLGWIIAMVYFWLLNKRDRVEQEKAFSASDQGDTTDSSAGTSSSSGNAVGYNSTNTAGE